MILRPHDFSVRYKWIEGSLPPPYHYEYEICIGPGVSGEIVFYPDYPIENPPVWTETFSVDDRALDELYALIMERELFTKKWTEIEDPPVGSHLEWLEVVAYRDHILVPSVIEESEIVNDAYSMIRSLVPAWIWSKLMRQRDQYKVEYLRNQGHNSTHI